MLHGYRHTSRSSFFFMTRRPPISPLFPYTTLFRSDVQFVAQRNTSSTPRSGSLTIAGLGYMVSQDGAPCSYTLRSEEHTSELQSLRHLVCRLLLEKKNIISTI